MIGPSPRPPTSVHRHTDYNSAIPSLYEVRVYRKRDMIAFLGQETLSDNGVGDHICSSRNCETDNGYNI